MDKNTESAIKQFFKGRDASHSLFVLLRKEIEVFGKPKVEVSKTQISFGETFKYAWVWLPQTWIKKRSENGLALTVVTGKKINSPRIEEAVQPKKGYWTHHILINTETDIDDEIREFLRRSYEFALGRKKQKMP